MRFLTKTTSLLIAVAIFIGRWFAAWDNSNFIDNNFRADSPNDSEIIDAVFGDSSIPQETAYTQHWDNNNCTGTNIDVEYYGTNGLPVALAPNTIYVLTWNQQLTSQIGFTGIWWCTAVLGSGTIQIMSNWVGDSLFYSNNQEGIIIDNFIVDGWFIDATMFTEFLNGSNITIHNIFAENFIDVGIYIANSDFVHIERTLISDAWDVGLYLDNINTIFLNEVITTDNEYWFFIQDGENIYINNVITANNNIHGWNTMNTTWLLVNNTYAFNNGGDGLYVRFSIDTIIQNSVFYHNNNVWLYIDISDNAVLHNINASHNNTNIQVEAAEDTAFHNIQNRHRASANGWIRLEDADNNTWYGTIHNMHTSSISLNNAITEVFGSTPFTTGSHTLWNDGEIIDTLTTNVFCNTMTFGLGFTNDFPYCNEWYGQQSRFTEWNLFTFGDNISLQEPTVIFENGSLVLDTNQEYTTYNTQKHIADFSFGWQLTTPNNANEYTDGWVTYTNEDVVRLITTLTDDVVYWLTGDIAQSYTGTINQSTNISIDRTSGDGYKTVRWVYVADEWIYSGQSSEIYLLLRYLDTTAPTIPQIVSPVNGATYLWYDLPLTWLPSVDTWAWVAEYIYELSTTSWFDTILYNGSTDQTTVTVTWITPNNHYRRVQAVDNLGQTSGRTSTGPVLYDFDYFDITFENTTFSTNSGQTVTITWFDSNADIVTWYQGTVTFSITGIDTAPNPDYSDFTLPNDYTFTLSNSGSHTFIEDFIITHPWIYEVTVQDSNYPSRIGTTTITVIGEYPSVFSGTFEATPAYTTGDVFLSFTGSQDSDFVLEGWVPTQTGTVTPGTWYQTWLLSSLTDGPVDIQLTLQTGYYTYTITQTVILDTTAPVVTLISPANNFMSPVSQVSLSWSSTEAWSPSFSWYQYVISWTNNGYLASGNMISNSMSTALPDGDYVRTIYAYDNAWNVGSESRNFTVDTTAPDIISASPTNQIVTVPFSFNRSVVDTWAMDYSLLTLYDSNGNIVSWPAQTSQMTLSTNALSINGLPTGLYTRELVVTDEAGNSSVQTYMFGVSNGIVGQIDGSVNLDSLFWDINFVDGIYYTNTTQLIANIFANMAVTADINWDITPSQLGLSLTMPFPYITQAITLTNNDGQKNLSTTLSATGLPDKTVATSVVLDTQDPSTATITSPSNGQTINGNVTFDWDDSTDTSWIAWYERSISTNSSFTNIIASGDTTNSDMTINTNTLSETWTLYRQVVTYDNAGNSSTTNYSTFQYNGVITPGDLVPNTFSFTDITNADLWQSYTSNSVTISGLGTSIQVQAQIDTGKLYINNTYVWTTWMISNGSIIKIELDAASDYEETNTATITISSLTRTFSITTEQEPGSVNDLDELQLTASPNNPEENERIDIRIRARDTDGDIITNYEWTVEFGVEYLDGRVRRTPNNSDYTLDESDYTFDSSDNGDTTLQNLLRLRNDNKNYRLVLEDSDAWIESMRYFCLRSNNCDEEWSTDLSRTQRLQIGIIFTSLVEAYESNPSNAILFFAALEDALTTLINSSDILELEEEALRYFRDLTKSFLDSLGWTTTGGDYNGQIYVAPNGKQYRVSFDSARQAYTSPDFTVAKYYISLEAFQAHINANNAWPQAGYFINWSWIQSGGGWLLDGIIGWWNINSPTGDTIVAPNGKVYRVTVSWWQYTSPDFIYPRQFPSYNALRDHIYTHNQ